jgi:uncharacterized protein (DUF697 family)
MVIRKYSQFISESNKAVSIVKSSDMSLLENEYLRMKSEGLSESEINENIFSSLFGSLGGGFTDTFKDYIIDWAAQKLGIDPLDESGQPTFFYQVIRNVIEQVHFTELGSYFGKGSCKNWARAIVEGLSETLQERGIEYLLPKLGLRIDMQGGMGGTIAAGLREALTNAINDTGFMNNVEKMIGDKICGFNLGDVLSGSNVTSTDKQKIASDIQNAESKDPNIFAKAMKSGLSSVLPSF